MRRGPTKPLAVRRQAQTAIGAEKPDIGDRPENHPGRRPEPGTGDRGDRGDGLRVLPGRLEVDVQRGLIEMVFRAVAAAPFVAPRMPRSGTAMSVMQTNFGPLGWVTDQAGGYRYQSHHPQTGRPWPAMPPMLADLWDQIAGYPAPAEACLVNWYRGGARMGLHVDADEAARDAPVLSISLGDDALFRIGGATRKCTTRTITLVSGDVVVLAGAARRFYHGVDRIVAGSSALIPGGGRINLTMRRVTPPAASSVL